MVVPLPFKVMLFMGLWQQVAVEFDLSADGAFAAALLVFFGTWIVRRFTLELAGLSEELTAALFVRGTVWLLLYFWLAPPLVRAQPCSFILCGLVAFVLAGMRCRVEFERHGYATGTAFLRDQSELTVGIAAAGIALAYLAHQRGGSVLPLVGYAALIGVPFSFGWLGGAPAAPSFDARFGDENTFRDAGVSEDH
jgi:hypothetical protein